jgi:uncharacterized membrane protein YcaP (DUF421 family)
MVIGPDGKPGELTLLQMSIRALLIFFIALAMVRIGDRRSLSEKTAFDAVFIVLLGAILARAINGSAPFFTTIGSSIVLVAMQRVCAYAACKWHWFGYVLKGKAVVLARDGVIDREQMNRKLISQHDFEEDLRLDGKTEDLSSIKIARLERSGDISFIKKE